MGKQVNPMARSPHARATEPTPPQPGLLSAPHDALLLITQHLSTRDRARMACSCKVLYSGSSGFWESIDLAPATAEEAESLLTWLGPCRSAIRHLKLIQTPQAEIDFGYYADGAWMQFDPDKYGCLVHLLGQLAGGPLESLSWSGERFFNSWALAALPSLRDCEMVVSAEACTSHLRSSFARLSELRRLGLSGECFFINWEPGCLPSSLEELTLKRVISCQWGPDQDDGDLLTAMIAAAASHATRLCSLTLLAILAVGEGVEELPTSFPLDGLNRLAHLTHLTLSATGPVPDLAPLAALTALQRLKLGFQDVPSARFGGQLQALTALSQLTSVAIHDPGLAELPSSIDALWHFPTLKAVDLMGSPVVRRLAEALDGSCIETLTLLPSSVMWMRRCRLPSLHTLEIDVSFVAGTRVQELAAACLRSVAANMQPTPPLLVWKYRSHRILRALVEGIGDDYQGPPTLMFQNFYKAGEDEYSSDDEGSAGEEEESEAEGSDGE